MAMEAQTKYEQTYQSNITVLAKELLSHSCRRAVVFFKRFETSPPARLKVSLVGVIDSSQRLTLRRCRTLDKSVSNTR